MSRMIVGGVLSALALTLALPVSAAAPSRAPDPLPHFDLGVDVTKLPAAPAEVDKYLASVSAEARQAILAACVSYLRHPEDAAMPQTVPFCAVALGRQAGSIPR
jgi:hypothetical protein